MVDWSVLLIVETKKVANLFSGKKINEKWFFQIFSDFFLLSVLGLIEELWSICVLLLLGNKEDLLLFFLVKKKKNYFNFFNVFIFFYDISNYFHVFFGGGLFL